MLAVLVAFKEEIGTFLKTTEFRELSRMGGLRVHKSDKLPHVLVAQGGFAYAAARESVKSVVSSFQPELIVTAGFAAGAKAGQVPGQIVVGDRLLAVAGTPQSWSVQERGELRTDDTILAALRSQLRGNGTNITTGATLTSPVLVNSSAMKRWIGQTFDVSTIDMESYWIAEESNRQNVNWLPIRVVLDPVEQSVSPLVGKSLEDNRPKRLARIIAHLATHPTDLAGLLRLSGQVRTAARSLSDFLTELSGTDLGRR